MNQQAVDAHMRNFPPQDQILQMEPEELAPHILRYMLQAHAMTNRHNFATCLPRGATTDLFMEARIGLSMKASSRIAQMTLRIVDRLPSPS
jgi:hypothetical protein